MRSELSTYVLFLLFYIGNEKVISSLKSSHDGSTEDRQWNFEYCDIMRSCGQFESTGNT